MIDPVIQIKERLSIADVVSSYITLSQSGKNLKAVCPFHNEKTPSFYVSPDRGSYYCFGCGAKGDVFTFVQEFEGLDFKGALDVLAKRAGVTLTAYQGEKGKKDHERLFLLMEEATKFFEKKLESSKSAHSYLEDRGLNQKTIKQFRVGVAPDSWRDLFDLLTQKGYSKKEQLAVGLIKESNGSTYDRFRNRIMFPIFDTSGRVIAFSGRAISPDEKTAKYLNSPETELFQKSDVLYGLHVAKNTIRSAGYSILVEGQFDLILSHQSGFANTIAASGTALTDKIQKGDSLNHFGIVKRLADTIILAFDSDPAGLKAMYRAAKICLSLDMEVKTAMIPEGKDPADIISKEGKDAWVKILESSEHVIVFLTRYITSKDTDMRVRGKHIREKVLPLVALIDSAIEKDSFADQISNISGISKEGIVVDLKKIVAGFSISSKQAPISKQTEHRNPHKEEQIVRTIAGMGILLGGNIQNESEIKALKEIRTYVAEKDCQAAAFEIEATYDDQKKLYEDFSLYIKEWQRLRKQKTLTELEEKIRNGGGDDILKQYQEILRDITN